MPLPKNKVPRELTRGLFNPEFIPRDVDLNDFVREAAIPAQQEEARERVVNRITRPAENPSGVPIPIDEFEAIEADKQIRKTLERIVAARQKLAFTRERLDEAINNHTNGKELRFRVDVSRKARVRKALRKLFGDNLDTITYSMYKEMLKARASLERQEVDEYAAGKSRRRS